MAVSQETQEPSVVELEQKCDNAAATFWISKALVAEYKKCVKLQGVDSLSDDLNATLRKRVAEIKGLETNPNSPNVNLEVERQQKYAGSQKRLFDLQLDVARMIKFLKEQHIWNEILPGFIEYIDFDGTFRKSTPKHEYGSKGSYEDFCLRFIEEASDREVEFKREMTRFLMKNRNNEYVYNFVSLVEKLREIRKLERFMLQYHADTLGPEEYAKLEESERQKTEAKAKREEQECVEREEAERKQNEEEEKREEREWKKGEEEDDSEEEEDSEKEDFEDEPLVPTTPEVSSVTDIVPVLGSEKP